MSPQHPAPSTRGAPRIEKSPGTDANGTTPGTGLSRISFEGTNHLAVSETTLYFFPVTQGQVHWNASLSTNTLSNTNGIKRNATIVAFNNAGNAKWATVVKGNYSLAQHIVSDGDAIWITGVGQDSTTLLFDTASLPVPQMQYVPYLTKLQIKSPPTAGTAAAENHAGLDVWPNPARGVLYIRNAGKATAHLFDPAGKVLRTLSLSDGGSPVAVQVSGLPRGLYFLEVRGAAGVTVQHVVLE